MKKKKKKRKLLRTASFKPSMKWGLVWAYPAYGYDSGDIGDQGGTVDGGGIGEENLFESYLRKVRHGRLF